jgi:hypothetical protein
VVVLYLDKPVREYTEQNLSMNSKSPNVTTFLAFPSAKSFQIKEGWSDERKGQRLMKMIKKRGSRARCFGADGVMV